MILQALLFTLDEYSSWRVRKVVRNDQLCQSSWGVRDQ